MAFDITVDLYYRLYNIIFPSNRICFNYWKSERHGLVYLPLYNKKVIIIIVIVLIN